MEGKMRRPAVSLYCFTVIATATASAPSASAEQSLDQLQWLVPSCAHAAGRNASLPREARQPRWSEGRPSPNPLSLSLQPRGHSSNPKLRKRRFTPRRPDDSSRRATLLSHKSTGSVVTALLGLRRAKSCNIPAKNDRSKRGKPVSYSSRYGQFLLPPAPPLWLGRLTKATSKTDTKSEQSRSFATTNQYAGFNDGDPLFTDGIETARGRRPE